MTPCIIAHRGARDEAIENTRAAFDKALNYPIDGIELDLRMTKDKTVIVYHDRTLFKLNASRKRISSHTYEQLCAVFPEKPMLTLSETLNRYAHRTYLMLEIKSDTTDRTSGRHLELTDKVIAELRNPNIAPYLDNIFILSFDTQVLKAAYRQFPGLKYVLNLSDSDADPTGAKSVMQLPHSEIAYLYAVCVNRKYLSEKLTRFAHHSKKQVMTYACNTLKQARHAISLNADVLMTDKPGWLTQQIL
jgi:glycerophosphoryl diester phosphodiesterase